MAYQKNRQSDSIPNYYKQLFKDGLIAGTVVSVGALIAMRYHVCNPNQFLVRTGLGIPSMSVSRQAVQWPFQKVAMFNMNPRTYSFELHNMSKGKVEFRLPVVFTIGPYDPHVNEQYFEAYAQTMNDMLEGDIEDTIQGVIEGETRSLTANLTVEEMFNAKDAFRDKVVSRIQEDLNKLGLYIYNANIKEMGDYDANNKYFEYRKQRAIQSANYEAQVEVSEAQKAGEIGVKLNERDTRQSLAIMEAEAVITENERDQRIAHSNAQLEEARARARQRQETANVEANNLVAQREEEMLTKVQQARVGRELEQERAKSLTHTKVKAEQRIAEADGEAESIRRMADANFYKACQEAQAQLEFKTREAEGIEKILQAHANGITEIIEASQSNTEFAQFYLGLKDNLYQDLAKQQANALTGLNPNISVWNTGSQEDSSNPLNSIIKMAQSVVPLADGLNKHAGIQLPGFPTKQVNG